jgi:hypothetical protein
VVRAGDRSLERLLSDRPGDVVILAGRNDRKITLMRRLHDAGLHVLADKPWLAGPEGLDDVRHTLAGGPLAMEIMTGRHEITSLLTRRLVGDSEVFGNFESAGRPSSSERPPPGEAGRRRAAPAPVVVFRRACPGLRRRRHSDAPRGSGSAGGGARRRRSVPELLSARRWPRVPLALFSRVTGETEFCPRCARPSPAATSA